MFLRAQRLNGMGDVTVAALRWADLQQQVMGNLASGNTQPMSNISVLASGAPLYTTDDTSGNDIQAIDIGGTRTIVQPLWREAPDLTPGGGGWDRPISELIGVNYALGNPDRAGWGIALYPGPNGSVRRYDFEQKDNFLQVMVAFVAAAVGMYYAIGALAAAGGGTSAGVSVSTDVVSDAGAAAGWTSGYDLPMGSDLLSMTGAGVTPTNWFNPSIKDALSTLKTVTGAITAITGAAAGGSATRTVAPTYRTGTTQQTMLVPTQQTMLMPMQMQTAAQGDDNSMLWIAAAVIGALLIGS